MLSTAVAVLNIIIKQRMYFKIQEPEGYREQPHRYLIFA
jgi:hypothetical protein